MVYIFFSRFLFRNLISLYYIHVHTIGEPGTVCVMHFSCVFFFSFFAFFIPHESGHPLPRLLRRNLIKLEILRFYSSLRDWDHLFPNGMNSHQTCLRKINSLKIILYCILGTAGLPRSWSTPNRNAQHFRDNLNFGCTRCTIFVF